MNFLSRQLVVLLCSASAAIAAPPGEIRNYPDLPEIKVGQRVLVVNQAATGCSYGTVTKTESSFSDGTPVYAFIRPENSRNVLKTGWGSIALSKQGICRKEVCITDSVRVDGQEVEIVGLFSRNSGFSKAACVRARNSRDIFLVDEIDDKPVVARSDHRSRRRYPGEVVTSDCARSKTAAHYKAKLSCESANPGAKNYCKAVFEKETKGLRCGNPNTPLFGCMLDPLAQSVCKYEVVYEYDPSSR